MRQTLERALVLLLLMAGLAACRPTIGPQVFVSLGGDKVYPGPEIECPQRCGEIEAEVRRWVEESADGAELTLVTFHSMVTADGRGYVVNRSGGSTTMAVATLTDGSQHALLVGCGVGIDPKRCLASP